MISSTNFNMGYNGSYMVTPLAKTKTVNGVEWSVKSNFEEEINKGVNKGVNEGANNYNTKSLMGNLDDLRRADSNHDNIISLNELRACDNKSEFMEHLIFELEQFEKTWKASNHR